MKTVIYRPLLKKIPAGKKYLEDIAAAEAAKDTVTAESDVYDHLYRFFERYYDNGDFMSRRYYARESDSRAAPYAVPYDGREVYLHWANKDQYYIKSSEYLNNYTFELNEAIRQEVERQKGLKGKGASLGLKDVVSEQALKVHFRIVDAREGDSYFNHLMVLVSKCCVLRSQNVFQTRSLRNAAALP